MGFVSAYGDGQQEADISALEGPMESRKHGMSTDVARSADTDPDPDPVLPMERLNDGVLRSSGRGDVKETAETAEPKEQ